MFDEFSVPEENPHIYIPAGAEALHEDPHLNHTAQAIIDRAGRRRSGTAILSAKAQLDYGRPGKRGESRRYAYDIMREQLLAAGIVETDHSFKIKKRAKVYRLTNSWADRRRIRSQAYFTNSDERSDGAKPVPPWLRYCVDSVSYDMEAAHHYLLAEARVDSALARKLVDSCGFDGPDGGCSAGYNAITAEIDRLAPELNGIVGEHMMSLWRWRIDRVSWAYRDPSQGRLHTPISNMAHELRPFLNFGNLSDEPLWQIDATNSQPLILATIAARALNTHDANDLLRICIEGQFYEETYLAVFGRYPSTDERKAWKPEIMKLWLYGPVKAMNDKKCQKLRANWPTVHDWISDRKKADGESALPNEMGELESSMWIDSLTRELNPLHVPVLTIHDSAVVPASRVAETRAAVERVYAAAGISAKLKVEKLSVEYGALEQRRKEHELKAAAKVKAPKRKAGLPTRSLH